MPNGNITIDKGVITSQIDNPDGSISIKAQLPCSQDITLTATPKSGYTLEYIKKNGVAKPSIVPAGDSIVFNSDGEPTINVRFKKDVPLPPASFNVKVTFNTIVSQVQNGFGGFAFTATNYSAGQTFSVPAGQTWTGIFGIDPNYGTSTYEIHELIVTTEDPDFYVPGATGQNSFAYSRIINKDTEIFMITRLKAVSTTYTISASGNTGGTISRSAITVSPGGSATVTATPASGYRIASIQVNGVLLNSFPTSGYTIPLNSINSNQIIYVLFELIPTSNITSALISRVVFSRLVGTATQATVWSDSSYVNATPTGLPGGRRLFSNGTQVIPFILPLNYAGTYLRTETDFTTGEVAIDEFIDSRSNNYLRLAADNISAWLGVLYISTRLNNFYGNSGNGFAAGQVALCQLKITDPDGVVTTFNHPVVTGGTGITDISHTYTLTKTGVYTLETETRLLSGNLKTSYGKTFVTVSPA